MNRTKILTLVLLGISIGWIASAWRFGLPLLPGAEAPEEKETIPSAGDPLEQLGLSDEVLAKVKEIRSASRAKSDEIQVELRDAKRSYLSAVREQKNEDELRKEFVRLMQLREQADRQRFEALLQVRSFLTPDQVTKLQKLRSARRESRGP